MTRAEDERDLRIMTLYRRGYSRSEIAVAVGIPRQQVMNLVKRIREQDCKYDPTEAPRYWRLR